jgi:conjugal transfer ATP-binding protein TraC
VGTLLEEGGRLYKTFYHVLTFSKPSEANRAEDALLDVFRANGWILERDKAISHGAYLAMLPMRIDSKLLADLAYFERLRTMTSFNVCNLLPLQGEWKGVGAPSLLLFGRRGQLCWWDNFANREGNYNVAVTGKSRSGKSVLMQDLAASVVGAGGRAFIFDVGRSFEKACKFLGGQFIEFRSDKPICINPFTQIIEFEESINMLLPVFGQMVSSKEELSELQEAFLQEALKKVWMVHGNQGNPSLVADWLKQHSDARAKDLGTMLYPYTLEGRYSAYVNGECNLDFSNPYIVLELEELKQKKDLQSVVLMLLMYHTTEFMYRGDRKQRMLCIIDEAWDLMSGKLGGTFIEAGYRRAAKYNGAFVSGTQSLEDYEKSPAARAAKTNADTLMIMSQLGDVIEKADKNAWIDMTPHLKQTLKSVKTLDGQYAEVCVKTPSGYSVMRLLLDPFSRILYSSKGQDYAAVNDLLAQGVDIATAIDTVAKGLHLSTTERGAS